MEVSSEKDTSSSIDLTIRSKFESNNNKTSFSSVVEQKENIIKCLNVSKSLNIKSANITGLSAELVSGSSILKQYLFYPEAKNTNNHKRKKYKEKLPPTITSPEWITLQELKDKDKKDKEQKKANIKLILMKKTDIQKRVKELLQNFKKKKANLIAGD